MRRTGERGTLSARKNRTSTARSSLDVWYADRSESANAGYTLVNTTDIIGSVIIESIVDVKIILVANAESLPYFSESMAVVAAAGIADDNTIAPIESVSARSSVRTPKNMAGMIISRKRE